MIPENLILMILWEAGLVLALIIVLLVLIIWQLLKKLVVSVTVVSVKTEATSYDHGDEVKISGDVFVDTTPQANTPVSLVVKDSTGTDYPLPDATTDADGKFTASWIIPPEVAPGVCTVSATAMGATAQTTFTYTEDEPLPLRRVTR